METIRLTAAQALVRAIAAQHTVVDGVEQRLFGGVWAIFGHGNVAGIGEALTGIRGELPTFRAHNEQAMAHAAIGYAKASRRRRMMACTTSIGPGATNLVTAAALAHVNRLPVLLLPGDVFADRAPDPVLQQLEDFGDATVSANDAFRPVSRYFDRITRPEQLIATLPRAFAVLTDPALCGPVTLALCQDVQAEAFDFPRALFEKQVRRPRRPRPDADELRDAAALLRAARSPFVIVGGGVLYAEAEAALAAFCDRHGLPCAETQAGKSALPSEHRLNLGAVGVTGTEAANALAAEADVVLAVGTRLQDFTTGSWSLLPPGVRIVGLNVQPFDAAKGRAQPLVADAGVGLQALGEALAEWRAPAAWTERAQARRRSWHEAARRFTDPPSHAALPSDAQVIGAVQREVRPTDVVVGAAGGLPGELHKHWQAGAAGGYHVEYGYSCMGYEIAGGLGAKIAHPEREVIVLVGDGSYLMMNSEIATSVMLERKLIIILLDNGGFGCIDRLQRASGGASFGNLRQDDAGRTVPAIDFVAHAASLGAIAQLVPDLGHFRDAFARARDAARTVVLVLQTDPAATTEAGGHWWDVAIPEVSERHEVREARSRYEAARRKRSVAGGDAT